MNSTLDIIENKDSIPEYLVDAGRYVVQCMLRDIKLEDFEDSESLLYFTTGGFEADKGCALASKKVLQYIVENALEKINTCFIIEGVQCYYFPNYHRLAIIEDENGIWYAYSPANYKSRGKLNRLVTILNGKSLEELIGVIKSHEGGIWPDSNDIIEKLPLAYEQIQKGCLDVRSDIKYAFPVFSGDKEARYQTAAIFEGEQ